MVIDLVGYSDRRAARVDAPTFEAFDMRIIFALGTGTHWVTIGKGTAARPRNGARRGQGRKSGWRPSALSGVSAPRFHRFGIALAFGSKMGAPNFPSSKFIDKPRDDN